MATKLKSNEIYRCWQSAAANDGLKVAEGARYRGDHPLVARFRDQFVPDATPDDEIDALKAEAWAPVLTSDSDPLGRCRVRILPARGKPTGRPVAVSGAKELFGGETIELEGRDAEHLVDAGVAEIIKHRPKKAEEGI